MSRTLNVYLCGKKIGMLCENDALQLSFQYCDNTVPALSVHLPVRTESYPHAYALPFFENLTPEGEAFGILTKNHVSGNKIFSMLDRYGGDCAGAVAFYETEPVQTSEEYLYEINTAKIAIIIDKLPEDPLLTSLKNPPRLSLAGAQSKFAVLKINNRYYRSNDEYPTTHIIKITNRKFHDLLENELFCMKLAHIMQIDAPEVTLKKVKNRRRNIFIPYLEIERYDRHIEQGIVSRIHQEDFCQALGLVSDNKYQASYRGAGRGASIKNCYTIIEEFSENRLKDITLFIEWIIFNYLIGNTDAHAKNLSLLHTETGIRLAPFYDLLSTEVYPGKLVDHSTAMLINGKGKYDSLTPNDFIALFGQLGLNATNMMKTIKSTFDPIITRAQDLRKSLLSTEISQKDCYKEIIKIIKKRHAVIFA